MISKSDVFLLATDLMNHGVDMTDDINLLMSSSSIPISVLKKINGYKSLDIINFYEKLRKSYNSKKSKLYINIMKADENIIKDPKTILTTLSALLNQILQYKVDDQVTFYTQARADEISKVLSIYFDSFNLEPASKLLALFKADIIALEYVNGKRS